MNPVQLMHPAGPPQLRVRPARTSCRLIDLDLATLFLRYRIGRLGECDLENAILELRRHQVRVDLVRNRERALKRTTGALNAVEGASFLLLLLIVLGSLLTPDGELVVHKGDVDVLFVDARQLRGQGYGFLILRDVDAGRHTSPMLRQGTWTGCGAA